jgi:hypothetical protein
MENSQSPTTEDVKPKNVANTYEDFDTYHGNRQTALTNASDAQIAPLLTAADYPPATIAAKLTELDALKKLSDAQKKSMASSMKPPKILMI